MRQRHSKILFNRNRDLTKEVVRRILTVFEKAVSTSLADVAPFADAK